MNPRNMLNNNQMIEYEVAQQMQIQQHPEPYILLGNTPNFPQASNHQILPTSGNIGNFDLHRVPHYGHQGLPIPNPELGIPTPTTFYNPYLSPATNASMMPSSSNFGPTARHISGYGVNSFPPNGFQNSSKRNGVDGFMGHTQYFNSPNPPTNMAMPPLNLAHFDGGVAILDACFPLPEFRGNHFGQSFRPNSSNWCERQPISPYFEGASTSRGSQNLPHYTPMVHPVHEFHPPQVIHAANRYNVNYRPPTSSGRNHVNNTMQFASMGHHPQQGHETLPPPPGIRIYRSHRRNVTPEAIHRNPNLPHLRLLEEGVAILEFSGHYEMSNAVDHHRDMRLDIDYMSYEELLALSERIGTVKTGVSEDEITAHVKTRVHRLSIASTDREELPCSDEKNDSCVICQDEYEENEKIGSLDCGHEYHVECLKKWLPVKNTCPICKATGLNVLKKKKKSGQIQ